MSVVWQKDAAHTIFSEASPLQGYGSDDLALAERELRSLREDELDEVMHRVSDVFDPSVTGAAGKWSQPVWEISVWSDRFRSPSARFCAEVLVLGAAARLCGVPLWRLISTECVAPALPTSTVLDPLSRDLSADFASAYERGIRTYKIKCGRDEVRERKAISLVAPAAGVRFRLDPNGVWNEERAERFLAELPTDRIDWIEDPTADPIQWPSIRGRTSVPFALDEPIGRGFTVEEAKAIRPDVIVIKPMAVGGVAASVKWAQAAELMGARVCVSHLFDGRAAMNAYLHLSFALQSPDRAPGLGLHAALAADPSDAPESDGVFVDVLRAPGLFHSKS